MARPRKEGNAYFSFDVDFFSDKKIKILKARYGADGITLYIYILCEVYKNGYYLEIDEDFEFIISDDLNMDCMKVKQVLNFLLERSLFDNKLFQSDKVLTSAGIQRRYQLMIKSRAIKNPVKIERYWLLSEEETETFIKVRRNPSNSEKNECYSENNPSNSEKNDTKEKGKKIKEDIYTAAPDKPFDNPELEKAFRLFIVCRSKGGDTLSPERLTALRSELQNLGADDRERIAIVNKAVANNWKSFYPIRKQAIAGKVAKKNRFNNFEQREYDYSSLEAQLLAQRGGNS